MICFIQLANTSSDKALLIGEVCCSLLMSCGLDRKREESSVFPKVLRLSGGEKSRIFSNSVRRIVAFGNIFDSLYRRVFSTFTAV